jgi:osmotically inducible protein OsmC
MRLEVRAAVPKIDTAEFRKIADATKDGCPISQVMKGNVPIELDAKLV